MSGNDRILVLGGTGMLGHELVRTLCHDFDVHASVRNRLRARTAGVAGVLHEFHAGAEGVGHLIASVRPAVVINCIGLVKQRPEASRPLDAIRINSLLPHEVAEACAALHSRLIHISTDCVFSGDLPPPRAYIEEDVPDARDLYGRTKLLGEVAEPPALTLRTSIIGWELGRVTGLLEWFAAQEGTRVSGYTNAIFSGLTTRTLGQIISKLMKEHPQMSGLYHVSAEPIDKYSLLVMLKETMGRDYEIVPDPSVRVNRTLDSDRFRSETRIEIPGWDRMLHEYLGERTDLAKA
jgi:dTDP-4-dehydrorhamnose reductase